MIHILTPKMLHMLVFAFPLSHGAVEKRTRNHGILETELRDGWISPWEFRNLEPEDRECIARIAEPGSIRGERAFDKR